jgi:hypothetical protein
LFQGAVSSTQHTGKDLSTHLEVFPNPADKWIRLSGVEEERPLQMQIIGTDGKVWNRISTTGGSAIFTGNLPAGFYVLKVRAEGGRWRTLKFVKE